MESVVMGISFVVAKVPATTSVRDTYDRTSDHPSRGRRQCLFETLIDSRKIP